MASTSIENQVKGSVDVARTKKGSQRITCYALVDKDSYVQFYVPEWFVALNPTEFEKVKQVPANAVRWEAKKPTKEPTTTDENLPTTGAGTTGNKIVRDQAPGGIPDENSPTKFIGKPVRVYFTDQVQQARGTKKYRKRTVRLHQAMNSMAVMYFLQQAIGDAQISAFAMGRTKYSLGTANITPENLGSLRDETGATTSKGSEPTTTP